MAFSQLGAVCTSNFAVVCATITQALPIFVLFLEMKGWMQPLILPIMKIKTKPTLKCLQIMYFIICKTPIEAI